MKCFIWAILVLAGSISNLYSQEMQYADKDWLVFGPGFGTKSNLGVTASYTLSGNTLYQFSWDGTGKLSWNNESKNSLGTFSFSFGKKLEFRYLLMAAFIGPSFVSGVDDGRDEYGFGARAGAQI